MKTKTTIHEMSQEDLVNLLSTATYGSSWLSCTVSKATRDAVKADGDTREDIWAKALLRGYPIYVTDHQAEGVTYGGLTSCVNSDDEESATYRVEMNDVLDGLGYAMDGDFEPNDEDEVELAARCVLHLRDGSSEFDNTEAEILMQIIMFGPVIY